MLQSVPYIVCILVASLGVPEKFLMYRQQLPPRVRCQYNPVEGAVATMDQRIGAGSSYPAR